MPGYKGHLAGGIVAYGCMLLLLNNPKVTCVTALGWGIITCAGALFPDIDIKSKGQKYFYWVILLLILWSIWRCKELNTVFRFNVLASLAVMSCLPMLINHRGITHEPWFVITVPCGVWFFLASLYPHYAYHLLYYALFFAVGALSHIVLDKGLFKKKRKW